MAIVGIVNRSGHAVGTGRCLSAVGHSCIAGLANVISVAALSRSPAVVGIRGKSEFPPCAALRKAGWLIMFLLFGLVGELWGLRFRSEGREGGGEWEGGLLEDT